MSRSHHHDKFLEYRATCSGCRREAEAGPATFPGIGSQRKLRYEQQIAFDIFKAQIHLSIPVRENPVLDQAIGEPLPIFMGIVSFDRNEGQNSGPNLCDFSIADPDRSPGNALNECDHFNLKFKAVLYETTSGDAKKFGPERFIVGDDAKKPQATLRYRSEFHVGRYYARRAGKLGLAGRHAIVRKSLSVVN